MRAQNFLPQKPQTRCQQSMLRTIGIVLRVIFGTGRQLSPLLNGQRDYKRGPFS